MSKLQNEDFKTEAQITGAGGTASQLLNDTKIWITANGLNKTLDDAITADDFAGAGASVDSSLVLDNITFTATISGSDLVIAAKGSNGNDHSGSNKGRIAFRNSSDNVGTYTIREITAATSVTIPNGGTLGFKSTQQQFVYISLHDNGTTGVLGVAASILEPRLTSSTTAIGTGSDDAHIIYTTSALTAKPYRIIARVSATNTAGVWSAPSNLILGTYETFYNDGVYARYSTDAGPTITTATSTVVVFEDFQEDSHNRMNTGTGVYTAPRPGRYAVSTYMETDSYSWGTNNYFEAQIKKNGTTVRRAQTRNMSSTGGTHLMFVWCTAYLQLNENDTIEVAVEHDRGANTALRGNGNYNYIEINRIGN